MPSHTRPPSPVKVPIAVIVKIQEIRVVLVDHVLNAQHEVLDELRAGVVFRVRTSVELPRVHALPPLALAIGFRQNAIVGHAFQRAGRVAAVPDRHELSPNPPRRAMIGDSELEPLRAGGLSPRAHDVLFRPDIHAVPGLVLRVPAIEVVMVVGDGDEVLGAGLGIEPDQFLGIPVLRPPDMADVFVPELRGCP